jgi:hypothetical protein
MLSIGADPAYRDGMVVETPKEEPKKKKKKAEPPKKKKETSSAAATEDIYANLSNRRIEEEDGGNALHIAVSLNDLEILSRVLGHPKAVELLAVKNLHGLTPLGLAVLLGHTRLVRKILAMIDLNTSEVDARGRSLLFHAVSMCHVDLVNFLLPSFVSTLETALTDRQGVRAVSLVLNSSSAVACATLLALERLVKGSVLGKFAAEVFELALVAGNVELTKLAIAGNFPDKFPRVLHAAVSTRSAASCRGFAQLLITAKLGPEVTETLLQQLDASLATDEGHGWRDHGEARMRVLEELRSRLANF